VTRQIGGPTAFLEYSSLVSAPSGELLAAWTAGDNPDTRVLVVATAPDDSVPPAIREFTASRRSLVRGRHKLSFRFELSEPAKVELVLRRGGRARLEKTASKPSGPGEVRLRAGRLRSLPPGRYRARLSATDAVDNTSRTRAVTIRVKRP
jgi:hypothetical protein